jgi:hypothetical protein
VSGDSTVETVTQRLKLALTQSLENH